MSDETLQAHQQRETADLVNYARGLQGSTPASTAGAKASGGAPPASAEWQGLGAETRGAGRALVIGGKTLYEHERLGFERILRGFSELVAPSSQEFTTAQIERAKGAFHVVQGLGTMGLGLLSGPAAALMAPIRERYPWMKDVTIARGATAQAFRDVTGMAVPFPAPDGLYMIRPSELLGETPRKGVTKITKLSEYGQDVPDLTLDEVLHTAMAFGAAAGTVTALAKGAKAAKGPEAETTPAKAALAAEAKPAVKTPPGEGEVQGQPMPEGVQPERLLDPQFPESPVIPEGTVGNTLYGINFTKLASEDAVKRVTMEINRQMYEQTNAELAAEGKVRTSEGAGGIRQTHAMTREQAGKSGLTMDDLIAGRFIKEGEPVSVLTAKKAAADAIDNALDAHIWKLVDAAKSGLPGAEADLNAAASLSYMAKEQIKELKSAAARTTEYGKAQRSQEANPLSLGDITGAVDNLAADQSGIPLSQYLDQLRIGQGKAPAESWLSKTIGAVLRTGKNMAWEYYVMAKLTSPTTWAKKAASDALTMAAAIPERALAEMNHRLFWPSDKLSTAPGEARVLAKGYEHATLNTIKLLRDQVTRPEGINLNELPGVQHWERDAAIAAKSVGIKGFTDLRRAVADQDPRAAITAAPGAALDVVGAAVRVGGNVLTTTTKIAQAINFGAESEALAYRQAMRDMARFAETPEFAAKVAERKGYILQHLDAPRFRHIVQGAQEAGERNTYTHQLGPAGQAFESWMNSVPGMRMNFLFYRVPLNLFKRATHYFPPTWAVSRVWGEMGRMWNEGGAARETALARLEMGVAASAAIGTQVASGKVTGSGPTNPAERDRWLATGRRPYSFYPNGFEADAKGFGYHTIAPFGLHVGFLADIGEISGHVHQDSPWYDQLLMLSAAGVLGVAQSMRDESFSRSWAEMVAALHQPDKAATHWTEQFLRGLVPTGWQRLQHSAFDENHLKDVRGPLDALKAAVWAHGMADRRNQITGAVELYSPGLGSDIAMPVTVSTINPDPVEQELWRNHISVPRLQRVVSGSREAPGELSLHEPSPRDGVVLTSPQQNRWLDLITENQALHADLAGLMASEHYRALPEYPNQLERELEVHKVLSRSRKVALQRLRNEDRLLDEAMRAREEFRIDIRRETTDTRSPQYGGALSIGR